MFNCDLTQPDKLLHIKISKKITKKLTPYFTKYGAAILVFIGGCFKEIIYDPLTGGHSSICDIIANYKGIKEALNEI